MIKKLARTAIAPLLAIVAALPFSPPAQAAESGVLPGPVPAVVERVVDGDTIDVRAVIWLGQELRVRVRLRGIDAPETNSRCPAARDLAARAQAALDHLLESRVITLVDISALGGFGRVLAGVRTPEGADPGGALLAQGLAKPYAPKAHCLWCPAEKSCAAAQPASLAP